MMAAREVRRVDAYMRVSRVGKRSGASFISPDEQLAQITAWAQAKGIEVVGVYDERDVSGGTMKRPELEKVMERVRTGATDGFVVAKLDRFARSLEGALASIKELDEHGASLIALDMPGGDPTTPEGKMMRNLMLVLAEWERDRRSKEWRDAKVRAVKRGAKISRTPLGYERENGRLVPDPATAPVVRRAYELAGSEGLQAAVTYLRDAKLISHAKHPTLGTTGNERTWTTVTVRRLLAQRVYLGESHYAGASEVLEPNPDAHEQLVNLAVWTRAQSEPNGKRAPSALFPLSHGSARCASCGGTMSGSRSGSKVKGNYRRMLKCTAKGCERPASVSAEPLEQHVRAELVGLARAAAELGHTAQELLGDESPRPARSSDAEAAESELRSAELLRDRDAADTRLREILGDDVFYERLTAHAEAIEAARRVYEEALAAAEPAPGKPEPAEIAAADDSELSGFLERLGLVVTVQPGRGGLGHRVVLEPRD